MVVKGIENITMVSRKEILVIRENQMAMEEVVNSVQNHDGGSLMDIQRVEFHTTVIPEQNRGIGFIDNREGFHYSSRPPDQPIVKSSSHKPPDSQNIHMDCVNEGNSKIEVVMETTLSQGVARKDSKFDVFDQ